MAGWYNLEKLLEAPEMTIKPEDIKKARSKVLLEFFVEPLPLMMTLIGSSVFLLSWAFSGSGMSKFLGILGVGLGIGFAFTRMLLNLDKLTDKAVKSLQDQIVREKEEQLNRLVKRLRITRELRDDKCLSRLRKIYKSFCDDVKNNKLDVGCEIIAQVDALFEECIDSLDHSLDLWEMSKKMPSGRKREIRTKRKNVLDEIDKSIEIIHSIIEKSIKMDAKERNNKLAELRNELSVQIRSAEAVHAKMQEIEFGVEENYEEYLEN